MIFLNRILLICDLRKGDETASLSISGYSFPPTKARVCIATWRSSGLKCCLHNTEYGDCLQSKPLTYSHLRAIRHLRHMLLFQGITRILRSSTHGHKTMAYSSIQGGGGTTVLRNTIALKPSILILTKATKHLYEYLDQK
uniref:Uncharacterized protein n=1 Tax=Lepeophtheirus salmonis TaxID=72036 RepID=A0A0K2T772_LEPSM